MNTGVWRLFDDLRTTTCRRDPSARGGPRRLAEQLRRIGCPVRTVWPFPAQLPVDAVVIFPCGPWASQRGQLVPVDTEATLIALSDYENPTTVKLLVDTQEHGVITKPYRSTGILSTLVLARASSGYQPDFTTKSARSRKQSRRDAISRRRYGF
ncbi:ANTAR domain-containing response regulator [Cupriavidus campinensis]